jgi:hypothetical protein
MRIDHAFHKGNASYGAKRVANYNLAAYLSVILQTQRLRQMNTKIGDVLRSNLEKCLVVLCIYNYLFCTYTHKNRLGFSRQFPLQSILSY